MKTQDGTDTILICKAVGAHRWHGDASTWPEPDIESVTRQLTEGLAEELIEGLMAGRSFRPQWLRVDDIEDPSRVAALEVDHQYEREQNFTMAASVREIRPDVMFLGTRAVVRDSPLRPNDDSDGLDQGIVLIVAERGHWPSFFFVRRGERVADGVWIETVSPVGGPVWAAMAEGNAR